MTETHLAERKAVQRLHRRIARELGPRLADQPEHMRQALIAQNTLRVCMETVLRDTLPYDARFLVELGTRLAAYAVTAGPPKQTHLMIETIQGLLPLMVENKQKTGSGIKADWIEP
jgi:hypothetical protein